MGLDEIAANPTYADNGGRMANLAVLVKEIEVVFAASTSADILDTLGKAGVMPHWVRSIRLASPILLAQHRL